MLSHYIFFWGGGGGAQALGEGCVKIKRIVPCLDWLTCLLLFRMVEVEKLLYSPDLKRLLIFNSWVRASVPRVIAGTEICK